MTAAPLDDRSRETAALLARAVALHQAGKLAEAEALYRSVLSRDDRRADAHRNYGALLHGLGRFKDAALQARRAITLDGSDPDAYLNLALALRKLRRPLAALAAVCRSLALRPNSAAAELTHANALQDLEQAEPAEAALRRALALQPNFAVALNNLGNTLVRRGDVAGAIGSYRRAISVEPAYAEAHYGLALALLSTGELAEGWYEYEWRWRRGGLKPRRFKAPTWTPDAPADATVFVHAEQGHGDTIQFARYVPTLTEQGYRVTFQAQPTLTRLLSGLGGATVVAKGTLTRRHDHQIALLSLPRALGTRLESIPNKVPYLVAPPDAEREWRERLAHDGRPTIGLAWRGSATFANDRKRSLDPALLAPLFGVPGLRLISLQREPRPGDLEALGALGTVEHIGDDLADFADTAGAIMALDLVISVDTAVAHLAGALARPVWILLPFAADWRWLLQRDDSPWYPTARLFRQAARDDWSGVATRVADALGQLSAGSFSP